MSLKTRIEKLEQNQPSSDVRIVKYFDGSMVSIDSPKPNASNDIWIGRGNGVPLVTINRRRFDE